MEWEEKHISHLIILKEETIDQFDVILLKLFATSS